MQISSYKLIYLKPVKIAVYSGEIPSTTFIENLIKGLTDKHVILLFGIRKRKVKYNSKSIKVYPLYKNPFLLGYFSFYWMVLNVLRNYSNFIRLKSHISGLNVSFRSKLRLWNKYGPVVYTSPDIFHLQWAKGVGEWLFLKEQFNIRLVVSFRGAHMNYSQITDKNLDKVYARVLPQYDGYHAVSQDILGNALTYGIDEQKACVIPPAVRDELLTKPEKTANKNSGTFKILSVGRNHWIKGYDVAIDACAILSRNKIDFTYTIVGGEANEELQFQIAQAGLEKQIFLLGVMPQAEVWELYRTSDLFLLPSHAEGIPNVVLEAMALGLPVISTMCGGVTSIINHNNNGWLVPVRNPQAMARQIMDFCTISHEQKELVVEAAFNTVKEKYVLSRQIDEMNAFYQSVVNSNK